MSRPDARRVFVAALVVLVLVVLGWLSSLEQVVLRTGAESERPHEATLWVADEGLYLWLEAPGSDPDWYQALLADPLVEVRRKGRTERFRAEVLPEETRHVEQLYREKYGLAHVLRSWVRDPERRIAIRLARLPDAGTRG